MLADKVEDYLAGAIYRTASGNFVYVEAGRHAGEFASIPVLKRIIGRVAGSVVKPKRKSK